MRSWAGCSLSNSRMAQDGGSSAMISSVPITKEPAGTQTCSTPWASVRVPPGSGGFVGVAVGTAVGFCVAVGAGVSVGGVVLVGVLALPLQPVARENAARIVRMVILVFI